MSENNEFRTQKEEILSQFEKAKAEYNSTSKKDKKPIRNKPLLMGFLMMTSLFFIFLIAFTVNKIMPTSADRTLDANYKKNFYDSIEQVNNIDVNLSKTLVSTDNSAMQNYLLDVAISSELLEADLGSLPIKDESKFYTSKLTNQIGDYAKYINKKLSIDEEISPSEYDTLLDLYNRNLKLKECLENIAINLTNNYTFSIDADESDIVVSYLSELENLSMDYPELIYDGPFSDGLVDRKIKGLGDTEINSDEARERFLDYFKDYALENIEVVGSAVGKIDCFAISGVLEGSSIYALISKTGGKLILYTFTPSCKEVNYDYSVAETIASDFILNLGIENMTAVWYNLVDNAYTINFVSKIGDTVIYPDMVKIKVCAESGRVIGFESTTYYTNHTDRTIESARYGFESAKEKVQNKIEIETSRLVVIPFGNESEKLCYEFSGKYQDATYYIYIDASDGRQVESFKVVESTEGTLLI